MNDYVIVNGKKYRKGYTTGSCAAAASKAAVSMLVSGKVLDSVEIGTPAGIRLKLALNDCLLSGGTAKCSIIKDGGDDPDMTTGLKIFAEVRYADKEGIHIKTGEGIGIATAPGLKVKIGEPAINPVPMKMILKEVSEVLPEGKGVEITFSVPGGEEVAKRTYNPKLGIIGGISILGTSGIVVPMSEEAWKDSLVLELSVVAAKGHSQVIFIFGNYGEDFVLDKLGLPADAIIKTSNFLGFMLEKAMEYDIREILLVGHMGKLVKVAGGIFHTHSKVADARMEILAAYAALEGAGRDTVSEIYSCKTTEGAAEVIKREGLTGIYDRVAANAAKRSMEHTFGKINVGAILFGADNEILAMDKTAEEMVKAIENR